MPFTKAADDLIAILAEAAKREISERTTPILRRIADALNDLEKALGQTKGGAASESRGAGASKAPAAVVEKPKRGRPPGGKAKRGALLESVLKVLSVAKMPLTPAQLRDILMATPEYKGRKKRSIYTQVIMALKKAGDKVHKSANGDYTLRGSRR